MKEIFPTEISSQILAYIAMQPAAGCIEIVNCFDQTAHHDIKTFFHRLQFESPNEKEKWAIFLKEKYCDATQQIPLEECHSIQLNNLSKFLQYNYSVLINDFIQRRN